MPAWPRQGGVVVEVEGKPCGSCYICFGHFGEDAIEAFDFAKTVTEEVDLGGVHCIGFALVRGEFANKGKDLRHIGDCRGSKAERYFHHGFLRSYP